MGDARAALLAGGLNTIDRLERIPESVMARMQHSAPLQSGGVLVELHRRMLHLGHSHRRGDDLADGPEFWSRCVRRSVAGAQIAFPCPTHLAIHLMVHAFYDHQLSNGPLVLSDLGFLDAAGGTDWPEVETTMQRMGYARGLTLTRALMVRQWGGLRGDVAGGGRQSALAPEPPRLAPESGVSAMMDLALGLMLREDAVNTDATILRALRAAPSVRARAKILLSALLPARSIIATVFPVREDSPWLWLLYLAWWWRHARRRLAPLLRGVSPRVLMTGAAELAQLDEWLRPERSAPPSPLAAR